MLWRRHHPQTQASGKTERRQKADETDWQRGNTTGSIPGGAVKGVIMPANPVSHRTPADIRITVYRVVGYITTIAILGLAVKLYLLDSVRIETNQMSPALYNGDRVLVWKAHHAPPFSWFISHSRHSPVIFARSNKTREFGCLRIAGKAGDEVSIADGRLSLLNKPLVAPLGTQDASGTIPPDYGPRDWLEPYTIPERGDEFILDTMSLRDFIFAWAVIHQENPDGKYALKPWLQINDSVIQDFYVTDFSLYRGPLDAIPPELSSQWFFWSNLLNYIQATHADEKISLEMSIVVNGSPKMRYTVMEHYYFLIADNWTDGFDSRYTGPVGYKSVKGRVLCVMWSFDPGKKKLSGFRPERICRIIR
jgi:signal peptidase I